MMNTENSVTFLEDVNVIQKMCHVTSLLKYMMSKAKCHDVFVLELWSSC
jgi:hypothetical protein